MKAFKNNYFSVGLERKMAVSPIVYLEGLMKKNSLDVCFLTI